MNARLITLAGLTALYFPCIPSVAAEQIVSCPPELANEAVQIGKVPTGWTASTPRSLRLSAVGMMAGPPVTKTELKPDGGHDFKGGSIESWDLADMPGERWISCQYGEDAVRLGRRLDDSVTFCSVTYTKTKPFGATKIEVRCKSGQ